MQHRTPSGVHTPEALRMGSRDQRQRVDGSTIHITQLDVSRLDPSTLYRVTHRAYVEVEIEGNLERMLVAQSVSLHDNVHQARAEFDRVHQHPPTTVQ